MKPYPKILSIFSVILLLTSAIHAQVFETYFEDKSLRMDYTIAGNHENTNIYFIQFKKEPYWGGSAKNLVDTFNYGDYKIMVNDAATDKLIYSRGYSNLFVEWQDTEEAKHLNRSFYDVVSMPFPKQKITIRIQKRNWDNKFETIFEMPADPKDIQIKKDKQLQYETDTIYYSGHHHKKLDIVIIPDGYTETETDKFLSDSKRFVEYFFDVEPFKSHKDKVNFHIVKAWSEESGTDVPGENIHKNTIVNSRFYTFGSERYLTTQDINKLRNLAAYVPYDQIYILVNTPKYGGGGIYNYYNLCTADHEASDRVFTHEFGHAFAALADEYAYGSEKAEDLYNMKTELWQVNITNLADFSQKWEHLVDSSTDIPTPATRRNRNKIGAFEGAGYVSKGIYRPMQDCKMRSNNTHEFCPVCKQAMLDMLLFYSE